MARHFTRGMRGFRRGDCLTRHAILINMPRIYLGLGSNLGDRARHIRNAMTSLIRAGIRITRQSSLYVTEPLEMLNQPWFLNCAVEAETHLMPRELLAVLRSIEAAAGRRRLMRSGPRVLDLDILLFGRAVFDSRWLEIPHPRIAERRFVLLPLCEIAPAARHPKLHRTVRQLLAAAKDNSLVRRWSFPSTQPFRREDSKAEVSR
jgi:2-amino-4-hydroxy-6-hydroxymethyldihydropteridine diphosphokinase